MISLPTFLCAELVAASLLGLWLAVRFPRLGPTSLRSAMLISGAAACGLRLVPYAVAPLVRLPHGVYAALFGCALPTLVAAFLAAAWLLRVLVQALGGSGGGSGLPNRV